MRRISRNLVAVLVFGMLASAASAQVDMIDPPGATSIREGANREDVRPYPSFSRRAGLDKASRKELESLRRVDKEDLTRYAQFLKGDNNGIFKLFPDNGCVSKNLIRVDGDCEGFVPDSSVYTFRTGMYGRWSGDLFLFKDHFATRMYFTQPILVSLGDVAIETVDGTHPAVRALADYAPVLTPAGAEQASVGFANGVEIGGFSFAASAGSWAGPTYAFRQIAFNASGKTPKQKARTRFGVFEVDVLKRNLQNQERKDTIYVFRVVRDEADGGITIVWKQLSRKDAPAIVFAKGDKIPNFYWAARVRADRLN